jgi:uncharacterized membrane protein
LPGSKVTGDVKLTQYVTPVVPAHVSLIEWITALHVGVAAVVGIATALKASTRPKATRILIIFLTSFLLSNYQAFPDFEAV